MQDLFLWNSSKAFADGAFENVALGDAELTLEQSAGCYIQAGCYTTPETPAPAFQALVASWNAFTPPGTAIEVQARIFARDAWSAWFTYGKWSPFIRRASISQEKAEGALASIDTDVVNVHVPGGATACQLRVYLYTDDVHVTPTIYLLAASVRAAARVREWGDCVCKSIPVPSYSQLNRDPRISCVICSPTTIAMLMNRFGEDLLPEEVAHITYDYTYQCYGNWSFTTAAAGCYGYECYVAYTDIAGLKKEIKNGFACGVSVHYAHDAATAAEKGLPLIDGASGDTDGHLMVVRGFEADEDGTEYVLVNDSYADSDETAQRRYALAQFDKAWNGVAYLLHAKNPAHARCGADRVSAEVRPTELAGEYAFYVRGEHKSLPINFCDNGTLCYTVRDETAYATAAHKRFYYPRVSETGNLLLDAAHMPAGSKLTIYIIFERGKMAVAELKL